MNTWLSPVFSIPQSKLAPYIDSNSWLINSCDFILFVPLLSTAEITASFVTFSLVIGVAKNIAYKFVLKLFVFTWCKVIPLLISCLL